MPEPKIAWDVLDIVMYGVLRSTIGSELLVEAGRRSNGRALDCKWRKIGCDSPPNLSFPGVCCLF